jgi:hypothetical protein
VNRAKKFFEDFARMPFNNGSPARRREKLPQLFLDFHGRQPSAPSASKESKACPPPGFCARVLSPFVRKKTPHRLPEERAEPSALAPGQWPATGQKILSEIAGGVGIETAPPHERIDGEPVRLGLQL